MTHPKKLSTQSMTKHNLISRPKNQHDYVESEAHDGIVRGQKRLHKRKSE